MSATVLSVLTARWLGPTDRGVLVTFIAASTFLMLIGSVGVPTGGRVLLATRLSLDRYMSIARTLSVLHVVGSATVGLGILWLSDALPDTVVAVLFVANAASQLYGYFQREGLHGFGFHATAISGELIWATVQIVLVATMHLIAGLNIDMACAAVLAGSVAQNLFLWRQIRRIRSAAPPVVDRLTFADIVRFSSPAAIGVFCQAFAYRGDRLILATLATTAAVGIYSVAATMAEVVGLMSLGVSQVVFRRMAVTGTGLWYKHIRNVAMLLTVCGCAAMALASPYLVWHVLGPAYVGAISVSYALIAAMVPLASYNLDIAALSGLGRLASARRINVVGASILLICCVVTVPFLNLWGATISTVAAYCVMALLARREIARSTSGRVSRRESDRTPA
ncbi:polysaccharide biosynthesis C-terminal domain-containing protein [Mycobacterium sp. OAE908]|uniref:polysaccharide biosynthesis C-terminal domain-containing protein n=1 Tax=Mycobacterium sp. OAE908 TaxID=2817899 RepID=UPI001AE4FA7F